MNKDFCDVLQEIVNFQTEEKLKLASRAISDLATELRGLLGDEDASAAILAIFSTSVAADGKLTSEEYALVSSFLRLGGIEMSDDDLFETIDRLSTGEAYDLVLKLNSILSEDGRASLFVLIAVICAIDDRIESSEVAFLSDLYESYES